MIPEREVDFIIAYDSSSDNVANKWVNGTTFEQSSKNAKELGIPFPEVPDATTFISLGMNQYPVSSDVFSLPHLIVVNPTQN